MKTLLPCFSRYKVDSLRLDWWQEFQCWRSQSWAGIWVRSLMQFYVKQQMVLWKKKEKHTQCVLALTLLWNLQPCELSTLPKNAFNPPLKSSECKHLQRRYLKACMGVVMFVPHVFTCLSYSKWVPKRRTSHLSPLLYCILHVLPFTPFYER